MHVKPLSGVMYQNLYSLSRSGDSTEPAVLTRVNSQVIIMLCRAELGDLQSYMHWSGHWN